MTLGALDDSWIFDLTGQQLEVVSNHALAVNAHEGGDHGTRSLRSVKYRVLRDSLRFRTGTGAEPDLSGRVEVRFQTACTPILCLKARLRAEGPFEMEWDQNGVVAFRVEPDHVELDTDSPDGPALTLEDGAASYFGPNSPSNRILNTGATLLNLLFANENFRYFVSNPFGPFRLTIRRL